MIEVMGVEELQIHPLHTRFGERPNSVDDFSRRADQGRVGAKLVDFTADRMRPPRDLSLISSRAYRERRRIDDVAGSAASLFHGVPNPAQLSAREFQRRKGKVELRREARRQRRGALGADAADNDRGVWLLNRLG